MKSKTVFICQQCGYESPKWVGQCPDCSNWNTFVESIKAGGAQSSGGAVTPSRPIDQFTQTLASVRESKGVRFSRLTTGIGEFDRVLGKSRDEEGVDRAGLVKGSVVMIAGEPGIGKSTLLTQTIINILINTSNVVVSEGAKKGSSRGGGDAVVMYVNGEESASQIADRVERIYKMYSKMNTKLRQDNEVYGGWRDRLVFVNTINVDEICSTIENLKPSVVIVDSIQTVRSESLSGAAGSFGQLRESTQRITEVVKRLDIPTVLVGHVTKEGTIAGPKVLEHVVDCVLELSGERTGEIRTLRAVKNRFGATDEVGLFTMFEEGLKELTNPSELFLQNAELKVPGSAIVCTMEGTRPLLMEVQALVLSSQLAMPRRVAQGVQVSKLQVLCAVLEKHGGIQLGTRDVFVNVAGGIQIREPAADLGMCLAMVSSEKNVPLSAKTICIGEVGLLGEIREVPFLKKRVSEAKRLGYTQIISSETHRHIRQVIKEVFKK